MLFIWVFILLYSAPVVVSPGTREVRLSINDLEFFEDTKHQFDIEDIIKPAFQSKFNKNLNFKPSDYDITTAYWVKLKINVPNVQEGYLVEFFDQTIDSLHVYLKHETDSVFIRSEMGDMLPFYQKAMAHKNFQIQLPKEGAYLLYFRVASHEYADIRVAIRSFRWFVKYALAEYYLYGIFYGVILIISLYNLLIYSAIREVKYLYYTFYLLSVGLFAMSVDGVGYQYLWWQSPQWNQIAHGVTLFFMIFWSILFSKKFLILSIRAPRLNKILNVVLGLRIGWFLYVLVFNHSLFQYRNIELIPLVLIFISSIVVFKGGYKPARFFIVAFGFLFSGFILKALLMLSIVPFYIPSYYSLHICFVFEMLFLSFALSDRVRILKSNRDKANQRIIAQHEEASLLKDQMTAKLESLVENRTLELQEKNDLLSQQKVEISEINSLLDLDNWRLRNNIKSIQLERLQNKELTYEEFREVFSDKEACLKSLSNYKWKIAYRCWKCENGTSSVVSVPYSRRCTKCGYQESPTTHTLFHGVRFPLEKAFYIFYETINKDQYSLSQLSEMLGLRKNTISDFKKRIKTQSEIERQHLNEIFKNIEQSVFYEK